MRKVYYIVGGIYGSGQRGSKSRQTEGATACFSMHSNKILLLITICTPGDNYCFNKRNCTQLGTLKVALLQFGSNVLVITIVVFEQYNCL